MAPLNLKLRLPRPVGRQHDWIASPASRKLLRIGRRGGKSRFAMLASIVGHGPGPLGARKFPGILQGTKDVVWAALNFPNLSTVMWREEFVPRFRHLPQFRLRQAPTPTVTAIDHGTLHLVSAEAIDSIRGIGKNLGGVVVDEAAHLDLEEVLLDVILPACIDNEAWLLLMSTTNAGDDGNSAKRVPSYFNVLCEQVRAGERSAEWEEFEGTAFDNPTLKRSAIDELVAEYVPGSTKLQEEVYARLLKTGLGFALDELTEEQHIIPPFAVPDHWTVFGAFDWGFNHPYCFGWFAADEDGNVFLVDTVWGRGELPAQIAAKVAKALPVARFKYTVAGLDCWSKVKARGENVPTIAETFAKLGIRLRQANTDRKPGLENLRGFVHWRATEDTEQVVPRFRLFDTPGNRRVFQQLVAMQKDPDDLEDALKVDANQAGVGGDDGYDMTRYGLASRVKKSQKAPVKQARSAFDPEVLKREAEKMRRVVSPSRKDLRRNVVF